MQKNNIRRKLDRSALEEALLELNQDFLDDLPETPQKLFEYTSRRAEPEISSSIDYELGQRMLKNRLSDKDYFITFLKIVRFVFSEKEKTLTPKANILLAQTGAGKSRLRELVLRKNPESVIINSDHFKRFRADANKLFEEDPTHFGALTGIDSYDHANDINMYAMENGYDILLECAPSTSQGMIGVNQKMLQDYLYDINYFGLAVGNLPSAFSIHKRYEEDIRNPKMKGEAKLTSLARHNDSYDAMSKIMQGIDLAKLHIYRRGTVEEKFVPQLVDGENKVGIFKKLQYESNVIYAKEQLANNMKEYNEIKRLMEERNADKSQIEQLEDVKKMLTQFCLHEQEKFDGCIEI